MTLCIKTSKKDGELIRKFLHEKELLEPTLKIKSTDNDLIIPLKRQLTKSEMRELEKLQIIHSIITYDQLENARIHPKSHLEILQEILTKEESRLQLSSAFNEIFLSDKTFFKIIV